MTIIVCHRDPDSSNEFIQFGETVEVIDVDYGYADLSDREEFDEWEAGHLDTAERLDQRGTEEATNAATHLRIAVAEARARFQS